MRYSPALRGLLVFTLIFAGAFAAPASDYDSLLAHARALAAENSHALARDAFLSARDAAPDASARDWCTLWSLAESAAIGRRGSHDSLRPEVETLLEPYAGRHPRPRDAFWAAALSLHADLVDWSDRDSTATDLLAVVDFWAAQPPTPDNASSFFDAAARAARNLVYSNAPYSSPARIADLQNRVAQAALHANASARPRFALLAAEIAYARGQFRGDLPDDPFPAALARALDATRDTPWAAAARRLDAYALTQRTASRESAVNPSDFDAWLARLDRALALPAEPSTAIVTVDSRDLTRARDRLAAPALVLEDNRAPADTLTPDSHLRFAIRAQHVARVALRVFPLTPAEFAARQDPPRRDAAPPPLPAAPALVDWTWTTGIPPGAHGRATRQLAVKRLLPPGFYLLVASDADQPDRLAPVTHLVTITAAQAIAFTHTDRQVEIIAQRTGDLAPIAALSGTVWIDRQPIPVTPATDGHLRFTLPPPATDDPWSPPRLLTGTADGQPFWLRIQLPYGRPDQQSWVLQLISDRPLYQPGDTVRWKLFARLRTPSGLTLPGDARFHLVAGTRGRDEILGRWEITFDAFGTATGELTLPADLRPARVAFALVENPDDPDDKLPGALVETFTVDHFRAPEARLTASLSADRALEVRPGGLIPLQIDARYFTGSPLPGAALEVTTTFAPGFRPFDIRRDAPPAPPQPLVQHLHADSDGHALVQIPIPADLPARSSAHCAIALNSQGTVARAELDLTLNPCALQGSFTRPGPIPLPDFDPGALYRDHAAPLPSRRLFLAPVTALPLVAHTTDALDRPLPATGFVLVERLVRDDIWRRADGTLLTGDALAAAIARRPDLPTYAFPAPDTTGELVHQGWRRLPVQRIDLTTDATGASAFEVPPLPVGRYEVSLHPLAATDDTPALARLGLLVADATTDRLPADPSGLPEIVPCDPVARPGQPLRALVVLPVAQRRLWLGLTTATDHTSRELQPAGNVALVSFPWTDSARSGASIEIAAFGREGAYLPRAHFTPDESPRRLSVALAALTADPRPGSSERIRISATPAAGSAASADVTFLASDASLGELVGADSPDAFADTFLRRAELPGTEASRSTAPFADRFHDENLPPDLPTPVNAMTDEGMVELSPFVVSSDEFGDVAYGASRAGARFLFDIGAVSIDDLEPAALARTRSTFRYTAAWFPSVGTSADGTAEVTFDYPDNLTAWDLRAYAVDTAGRFGAARIETHPSLPLQARLRAPRSLVAGDRAILAGTAVNTTGQPLSARATLALTTSAAARLADSSPRALALAAHSESTATWPLVAIAPGRAILSLAVAAAPESDAMEQSLPIAEDGFLQRSGTAGRLTAAAPVTLAFDLPAPLDPARATATVTLAPGVTGALMESLPYLVDYPYGCVEQTMSRFLPALAVRQLLAQTGFTAAEVDAALTRRRAELAGADPARIQNLDAVVAASLARLQTARGSHDAFGWWPDGEPDPYMTGYVLRGLDLATRTGLALPGDLHAETFTATLGFLDDDSPASPAVKAWCLAAATAYPGPIETPDREKLTNAFDDLFEHRDTLPPAGLALLLQSAAALHADSDDIAVLLRNLENGVVRAHSREFGDTAQWGRASGYLDGMEGAVETTALALDALLAAAPDNPLADPAARWLLLNRQSGHWSNTRDTALAVLALADWARLRGETHSDATVTLTLNGHPLPRQSLDRTALLAPVRLQLAPDFLRPGDNTLVATRATGAAPVELSLLTQAWAASDTARPSGDFLRATRELDHLRPRPTQIGEVTLTPVTLASAAAASVPAGDQLECHVTLTVAHDIDYVMVSVPRPGGCEPLSPLSSHDARLVSLDHPDNSPDAGRAIYREGGEDRSVFFLAHLPAGRWEIRYRLQAVFAGDYRLLPATAEAMYVPLIQASTDAPRLAIAPSSPAP